MDTRASLPVGFTPIRIADSASNLGNYKLLFKGKRGTVIAEQTEVYGGITYTHEPEQKDLDSLMVFAADWYEWTEKTRAFILDLNPVLDYWEMIVSPIRDRADGYIDDMVLIILEAMESGVI